MILFTFFILLTVFFIWGLFQNERTYKQKRKMVKVVFSDRENYAELLKALNEVSYNKHFMTALFFRNPIKLYRQDLQEAYKKLEE